METQVDSDILTVEELHVYLKIPRPTLYALAQTGRIPAAKIGRHWRFRKSDISAWLDAQCQRQAGRAEPHHADPSQVHVSQ